MGNDHAGGIPAVLARCPNALLVTSAPAGIKGLEAHFGSLEADLVKTGDGLSLGANSLHFVQTPMLHWPDNTMAFIPEEGILFSSDAFGQHYASGIRFADEVPRQNLFKGLTPKGRIGLAFGSYGWSGQSPAQVQKAMQNMGWQTPLDPFKLVYRPKAEDLTALEETVKNILK